MLQHKTIMLPSRSGKERLIVRQGCQIVSFGANMTQFGCQIWHCYFVVRQTGFVNELMSIKNTRSTRISIDNKKYTQSRLCIIFTKILGENFKSIFPYKLKLFSKDYIFTQTIKFKCRIIKKKSINIYQFICFTILIPLKIAYNLD